MTQAAAPWLIWGYLYCACKFLSMKRFLYCAFFVLNSCNADSQQPTKPAAILRGDLAQKKIFLIFSGDEFGDGAKFIQQTLKTHQVPGSFFLTGNFYRSPGFREVIGQLQADGHYLASHSDKHLLYCDWIKRDSLLVTKEMFRTDLQNSYKELARWKISIKSAKYFLPPYEWFNDSIVTWTDEMGLQLINFTPGTRITADYTFPEMGNRYVDSKTIYQSIIDAEAKNETGLNGFILLIHIGTDPRRRDKFYLHLPKLIAELREKKYHFARIDDL